MLWKPEYRCTTRRIAGSCTGGRHEGEGKLIRTWFVSQRPVEDFRRGPIGEEGGGREMRVSQREEGVRSLRRRGRKLVGCNSVRGGWCAMRVRWKFLQESPIRFCRRQGSDPRTRAGPKVSLHEQQGPVGRFSLRGPHLPQLVSALWLKRLLLRRCVSSATHLSWNDTHHAREHVQALPSLPLSPFLQRGDRAWAWASVDITNYPDPRRKSICVAGFKSSVSMSQVDERWPHGIAGLRRSV
jgi:hypothetical protein